MQPNRETAPVFNTGSDWRRWLLISATYLVAHVALDFVSYVKPYGNLGVTPWNPQMGMNLALIVVGGLSYTGPVLVAQLLSDYLLRSGLLGLPLEAITSAISGLICVVAGWLLRDVLPIDRRLPALKDAWRLITVSIVCCLFGSIIYTLALSAGGALGRGEMFSVIWRLSVGNVIGILAVAPALLVFSHVRTLPKIDRGMLAQGAAIVAAIVFVFGYRDATAFQLFYLLFLPLLWVALTHGTAGTALALPLIQIGLVIGAEIRFGSDPGLTALQVLMITLAITGLLVGAIFIERQNAAASIQDQQNALSRALRVRTAGEIASGIAHEINQPLAAIRSYAAVAEGAVAKGNAALAQEAISKMSAQSARAATIIRSVRDLLHQGTIDATRTELPRLLAELDDVIRPDLALRNIHLTIEVPPDFPDVRVDGVQVVQALINLINNAADAMEAVGRWGEIKVSAATLGGGFYALSVKDRGPGFPPGYNIKEPTPFVTTKPEGTGLGLSIARTIAEAHGGRLVLQTSPEGACVTLQLPFGDQSDDNQGFGS
jgi:signal transduction histidine kinase